MESALVSEWLPARSTAQQDWAVLHVLVPRTRHLGPLCVQAGASVSSGLPRSKRVDDLVWGQIYDELYTRAVRAVNRVAERLDRVSAKWRPIDLVVWDQVRVPVWAHMWESTNQVSRSKA